MPRVSRALRVFPGMDRRLRRPIGTVSTLTTAVMTALYGARAFGVDAPAPTDENALQEVVVTASRRAVSAQDLPISITAVTGAALDQAGIQDIAGLAHAMAGVNFTDKGPFGGVNGSTLIIRGLNSEATAGQLALASPVVPPVATYVDETPLFVNLRLQDLDHVEILRGPQGTLYGSGSLGGTIRFVQNAPDPSGFDAKVETGLSKTAHTHSVNDDVSGMLNLPVTDTFAVRLNASYTDDAGFINQPNLYVLNSAGAPVAANPANPLTSPPLKYSEDGVNSYEYRTARVAALWKPNEDFHAQLSYYYQVAGAGGFPYVATTPLAYNQPIRAANQPAGTTPPLLPQLYTAPVPPGVDSLSSATNSLETTRDKVDLVALTLEYDLGFATMTSASSFAHHNNQTDSDLTALYTNFFFFQNFYGQNPRSFVQGEDQLDDKNWSQELRLASKTGGLFDWVAGAFFKRQQTYIQEHEFYPGYNDFYNACTAAGGTQPDNSGVNPSQCGFGEYGPETGTTEVDGIPLEKDQAYIGDFETSFKDLAIFGELTWHMTDAWSLTGGTRLFKQTLSQSQQTGLLFDGPAFAANESLSDEWRRALWKINTSYQLDKNNLVYATWSQGFRRGGVNALPPTEAVIDPTTGKNYVTPPALTRLQPDTADNYEIGVKGTVANRVRYSAAIYDIQWHNIQEGVQLTPLVLPASLNIGEAFSRGVETEIYASVTAHLGAQIDYTYDQTKLTSLNPLFVSPNVAVPPPAIGTPLPGTPKSSLAVSLDYGHMGFAGGEFLYAISAHYQSDVIPALSATVPTVPGYTMLDTRLTYTHTHWMGSLYVNNVTNTLGISAYSDPAIFGNRYQAIVSQPRTVGFTVGYSFKER
ncbi:MAG: TonB-dependent receptor [Steroidobacteraceae bacterium]|jgi:iron complex outermembrane receptor protein